MKLIEYILANKESGSFPSTPRITCVDGFSLSVQTSKFTYCTPRVDHSDAYTHVEVGFPSAEPEFIMDFADDPDNPKESVYPYTPIELVQQLIDLHGGIA